jgi:hypothetical protein
LNLVNLCIKIPKDLYDELEKRAKIIGINSQTYVRTLLERHISRTKGGTHGFSAREVDLVNKLRLIIKNIDEDARNNFRNIDISKPCIEDLKHVIKEIFEEIKLNLVEVCGGQPLKKCKEYIELENLRSKLGGMRDPGEMVKVLAPKYEDSVLLRLKLLFYMERCTLAELAKITYSASPNLFYKMILILLDIYIK